MSATLQQRLAAHLRGRAADLAPTPHVQVEGKLTRMVGLTLEAIGLPAVIGSRCLVRQPGLADIEAEVVGFAGDFMSLMPIDPVHGLGPSARVMPLRHGALAPVGPGLLGRVLDGAGRPLDGKGPIRAAGHVPLTGTPQNPLGRPPIREPLDVGVRSINALLTVGRGQRLGLFAGSGVGKSVLLGMMTRYTAADVVVVGLIGERGREVNEFVTSILGAEGLRKAVVVTAPADTTALQRLQGAMLATAIAEYFRDQGLSVLLLLDSLTRVAHAQREIALSVGEPPATKGYPPSVFARLPALIERAGTAPGGGSITAFYTVLTEGDDPNDPIADSARAILDGHIVLSRDIAETGLYPAIDMEASVSRLMVELATPEQLAAARRFRQLYSTFRQNRDLVAVGAYQAGADPLLDEAIARQPQLLDFLRQDLRQGIDFASSVGGLDALFAGAGA
jgi:flagellum-specific ATP synthase